MKFKNSWILLLFVVFACQQNKPSFDPSIIQGLDISPMKMRYGFNLNQYEVINDTIAQNEFLSQILNRHGVSSRKIHNLTQIAKDSLDVRGLRANKPYTILKNENDSIASHFIYEPSPLRYIVYDLGDSIKAEMHYRKVDTVRNVITGHIDTSLWLSMRKHNLPPLAMAQLVDIMAEHAFVSSVSFDRVQNGDQYKMIFDEYHVDGKFVALGEVHAAWFKNESNDYYAIRYDNDKFDGFYDLETRPMKKTFLKAPVKFSRISSRYNLRRKHPVLGYVKPHLGTDFAAPKNTPIRATAAGVVTKRSFTRGNGRYVKIKHNKTYSTQYLHMNKFEPTVKVGTQVKQGQTIGYVGKTGLATGYHVCYRFWKNGKQVNPLREKLPEPDPMPESEIPDFNKVKDKFKQELDALQVSGPVM